LITSQYKFRAVDIGLSILALPIGGILAVPAQFSMFYLTNFRHRSNVIMHNNNYGHENAGQHPYRAALWLSVGLLPLSSVGFTMTVVGPPMHFMLPVFFAALVSFSGTLAASECYLLLMDNFDVSDLPEPAFSSDSSSLLPRGTSRGPPNGIQQSTRSIASAGRIAFRTSHPCLSAALAITHTIAFLFAGITIGVGSYLEESLGLRNGMAVATGITGAMTAGLVCALWRNKNVRLMEVFGGEGRERMAQVSLLQRGWGTRWSEVNGMEWWEDGRAV
jgi:hypothetical protein